MRTFHVIFAAPRRTPAAIAAFLSHSRALDAANGAGRYRAGPWLRDRGADASLDRPLGRDRGADAPLDQVDRRDIDVCLPWTPPTELLATRVTQRRRGNCVTFGAGLAGVAVESQYRAWSSDGGDTVVEATVTVDGAALPWPVRDAVEAWVLERAEASVRAVMEAGLQGEPF